MCGIVGYIGTEKSVSILLKGLKRLEYRGYDSSGLALVYDGRLEVIRRQGNLAHLQRAVNDNRQKIALGLGHTRWATHGQPSEENAHPHLDCHREIAVVHNGIVENFQELKQKLIKSGHHFRSQTDTEIIAHLIEEKYDGDLLLAVRQALKEVVGSYALAAINVCHPDTLVAARKNSPLIIGVAKDSFLVASDIPAVLDHTRQVVILEDGDLAVIKKEGYDIQDETGRQVKRPQITVNWDIQAAEKGGYDDFMLKEIFEQPQAVANTIAGRIRDNGQVVLPDLGISEFELKALSRIVIVACGTSLHAAMVAKRAIERWAKVAVEVDCSSEFRYRQPILNSDNLVILITQSGETADTLACAKLVNKLGARILSITNVVGSSITRLSDGVVYTHAGPEIGVAATKTFVAQLAALILFAAYLGQVKEKLDLTTAKSITQALRRLPEKINQILKKSNQVRQLADKYTKVYDLLFLGRGVGYPIAMEGALKLKEISYIHAEGYPAGEMKHGPIALISSEVPIMVIATTNSVYDKVISNIEEARSRGGEVIAIANEDDKQINQLVDQVIYLPQTMEMLTPILSVVPLQLFAYYIAKKRGCNVDQPRNLAKSVTVE
jgi:glucosamine--fructose-6-phosphate aminotransferase (isomerizing)